MILKAICLNIKKKYCEGAKLHVILIFFHSCAMKLTLCSEFFNFEGLMSKMQLLIQIYVLLMRDDTDYDWNKKFNVWTRMKRIGSKFQSVKSNKLYLQNLLKIPNVSGFVGKFQILRFLFMLRDPRPMATYEGPRSYKSTYSRVWSLKTYLYFHWN